MPLIQPTQVDRALDVFSEFGLRNQEERVIWVRGQIRLAMVLAGAAQASEREPTDYAIEELRVGGNHLSSRGEAYLETWLGGTVRRIFGMTEFYQSYANECLLCGDYHFNWTVVPEVVGESEECAADCVGELVLSHLFPFSLRQPLIRYRTGDLATVRSGGCATGRKRFVFHGRKAQEIPLQDRRLDGYVSTAHVAVALDSLGSHIARERVSLFGEATVADHRYGDPLYLLTPGPGSVEISVGMPDTGSYTAAQVKDHLLTCLESLRSLHERGLGIRIKRLERFGY